MTIDAPRVGGQWVQWAIIGLLLWILAFLLPSEGGFVDGIPIGRVETIGLMLIGWIAAHRVRIPGGWLAAVVAGGALIASMAVPGEPGFRARYYANAAANGQHERSTDYRNRDFTRVDRRLDFVRGERDLSLAFFNDHTRFNYLRPGEPDRRYLEFAVSWTGWWHVREGEHLVYLHAPEASSQLSVDGAPVLSSTAQSSVETRVMTLTEGWHRLQVTFSSPYGAPRVFAAGISVDDVATPFSVANVRTERIDSRQAVVAAALRIVKPAADLAALAWLASLAGLLLVRRLGELWQGGLSAPTAGLSLFVAAGAVEALRYAWPWAERFMNMVAGDDPMTYEAYARDILFNGILMNGGAPLGQGEPFYYQAFYPYFLAGCHAVFGEGMFGVLLLQRFFVVLTAVAATRIAMTFRGDAVWPIGLLVSGLFVWWKFARIAADLLNESLYIPLLIGWTGSLITLCLQPSAAQGALAGFAGGLAAITRSTAMLSWALVWPACHRHLQAGRRLQAMTMLIACSVAVFSLIAVRNWFVSHQFAPTSTELGITLLGGNPPPPDVTLDLSTRRPFYERIGIGGYTMEVIEYAIAAPGHFTAHMGRKALFALGIYEPYAPGWGYSWVYLAVWISAMAGVAIAVRRARPRPIPALIPLLVAVTQFVAVVLVYPKGERLILPIHAVLLPYAIVAAYSLVARLRPFSSHEHE